MSDWGLLVHALKSTTSPNERSFGVFGLILYTVRSFGLGSFELSWLLAFGLLASELVNQSPLPKLACLSVGGKECKKLQHNIMIILSRNLKTVLIFNLLLSVSNDSGCGVTDIIDDIKLWNDGLLLSEFDIIDMTYCMHNIVVCLVVYKGKV